jgi:hypothetical protein
MGRVESSESEDIVMEKVVTALLVELAVLVIRWLFRESVPLPTT